MHTKQQFCNLLSSTIWRAAKLALAIVILCAPIAVLAQSANSGILPIYQGAMVTVDSHAGPWLQSLNPAYDYGFRDNAGPTIVNQANSGIVFIPGKGLTIAYLSGLVSAGGVLPFTDANGDITSPYGCGPGLIEPNPPKHLPCFYTDLSKKTHLMELMGVFADSNGVIVGQPFTIGDGPYGVVIPAGATQLQMGVTDDIYRDNMGSFAILVTQYGPISTCTP